MLHFRYIVSIFNNEEEREMKKNVSIGILILIIGFVLSCTSLKTATVSYNADDVILKGYLAYDPGIKGKRPGVLVVHEWWGHNDYARMRARMLAELGYTVLAVDMYGDGKQATHPDEAGKFAADVMANMDIASERFFAAMEVLKRQDTVDPERIAAIGYCFGGGIVLQMAREGVDLDGVVSFHGSLATSRPATAGVVKAKILVAHGADDTFVTQEQVDAFKKEMADAGVSYRFIEYSGAMHSFTNPEADVNAKKFNIPIAYSSEADKKSWNDMKAFLKDIFGK